MSSHNHNQLHPNSDEAIRANEVRAGYVEVSQAMAQRYNITNLAVAAGQQIAQEAVTVPVDPEAARRMEAAELAEYVTSRVMQQRAENMALAPGDYPEADPNPDELVGAAQG